MYVTSWRQNRKDERAYYHILVSFWIIENDDVSLQKKKRELAGYNAREIKSTRLVLDKFWSIPYCHWSAHIVGWVRETNTRWIGPFELNPWRQRWWIRLFYFLLVVSCGVERWWSVSSGAHVPSFFQSLLATVTLFRSLLPHLRAYTPKRRCISCSLLSSILLGISIASHLGAVL